MHIQHIWIILVTACVCLAASFSTVVRIECRRRTSPLSLVRRWSGRRKRKCRSSPCLWFNAVNWLSTCCRITRSYSVSKWLSVFCCSLGRLNVLNRLQVDCLSVLLVCRPYAKFLPCVERAFSRWGCVLFVWQVHFIGINPGAVGRSPRVWDGVVGSLWNIIISYNGQKYEMRTLSKVVTFQK